MQDLIKEMSFCYGAEGMQEELRRLNEVVLQSPAIADMTKNEKADLALFMTHIHQVMSAISKK
tara:strand:- start:374 stop:562 length:189 start_codon:yes stop_codon:yes gene_type:complete